MGSSRGGESIRFVMQATLVAFVMFFVGREIRANGARSPRVGEVQKQPTLNARRSPGAVLRPDVDPATTLDLKALKKKKRDEQVQDLVESMKTADRLLNGEPDLSDVSPNVIRSPFGRSGSESPIDFEPVIENGRTRYKITGVQEGSDYSGVYTTDPKDGANIVDEMPPSPEDMAARVNGSRSKSSGASSGHSASH